MWLIVPSWEFSRLGITNLMLYELWFLRLTKTRRTYAFFRRNLEKEVESYQTKVVRKTGPTDYSKEDNVCEICHKTKFAEGSGRECKYCKRKVCARCGVQVTIPGSKQVNFGSYFLHVKMCKKNLSLIISTQHSHVFL